MDNSTKIDVVVTWVDGDDPRHRAKRQQFGNAQIAGREDVGGVTRFRSVGEILYCIASINRFAPWVNKIYLVTDEQNPNIDDDIARLFPEGHIPMEIVDHKTIFRGYEEYLPTFNSISIESMTWRIPGLSERFIEFNDDLILAAPTTPEDFFTPDGGVVCYGDRRLSTFVRLSRILKYRGDGTKRVSFKESMLNATKLAGGGCHFIKLHHTPKALLRSIYEEHYAQHPDHLTRNIAHRFRHATQYNPEEMQYLKLYRDGRCLLRSVEDNLFYFMGNDDMGYLQRKLSLFTAQSTKKFGCFNSLDKVSEEGQKMVIDWIERRIHIK